MKKTLVEVWGCAVLLLAGTIGCSTTEVQSQSGSQVADVWSLPEGFSPDSIKSRVAVHIANPIKTDGSTLPPGLAGQFLEFAKSKLIQSKRFVVYLGDTVATDTDVVMMPFVDYIRQTHKKDGRDWMHVIAQVSIDVKFAQREDGVAQEAITFKGVSKTAVPSVFGKPARDIDEAGLINRAFDDVYSMLIDSIDRHFPVSTPAQVKVFGRSARVLAEGGTNIGLERGREQLLYMLDADGAPIVLARLSIGHVGLDRAAFKVVEWNPDEEAAYYANELWQGKELDLFVAQK